MITFFKDDMQNKMYTMSFLQDTRYYDELHSMYEKICKFRGTYQLRGIVDSDLADKIAYDWNEYAYKRRYKVSDICRFFKIREDVLIHELQLACIKYRIPSNGSDTFFDDLYNIQRGIKTAGTKVVMHSELRNVSTTKRDIQVNNNHRYVIALRDSGRLSRYIIVRLRYSFGVFDTIETKMIAYKNFKTGKSYGDWDKSTEQIVLASYNAALHRYEKQSKSKTVTQTVMAKKGLKATNNINNTVNSKADSKANNIHSNDNNINSKANNINSKANNINTLNQTRVDNRLTQQAYSKLHKVTNDLSNRYKVPILDIDKHVSKHDALLLNTYMENNELEKFETVARRVFDSAFIDMVDHKDKAIVTISYEANSYYNNLKNRNSVGVTSRLANNSPRDREYRAPVERGLLINRRGESIDGGDNKYNQTQIGIKMDDNDFIKLCNSFGISKPDQSQLNGIVESVLQQKFESYQQYTLSDKARLAVLYHRDSRKQSLVSKYEACYIPSEYNAYITKIQRANYGTPNFKNSKTFVLSAILHEYVGYM